MLFCCQVVFLSHDWEILSLDLRYDSDHPSAAEATCVMQCLERLDIAKCHVNLHVSMQQSSDCRI